MSRGGAGYASGKNALAICERCGLRIKYKDLQYDGDIPSLKVCRDCWDPQHPQEFLPPTFDPVTLYDPTGDPDKAVAGGLISIRSSWQAWPLRPITFGIGVGLAAAVFSSSDSAATGDSFSQDAFDIVSFSQDALDL